MKKIFKHPALFYLMIVLFLFKYGVSFSQIKEFTGKNVIQPYSDYLGKYLKKYSVYTLDLNEVAAHAKNHFQKAQFILNLSSERFKLEVELNEMRGKDFKAVAMTDKGPSELVQTFANTYKGFENNNHANIVRLNIDESTFEGYINIGKRWLYFDKLNRYIKTESNDKIVVYNGEDVIPDPTKKCGAEKIDAEKKKLIPDNSQNIALTGNCHFFEIATEADFEYFQAFSGNANAALNNITNILNLVEGLYTSAFNVKFILRYQQIWTTALDPYSGDMLLPVILQFKNWWNANRSSVLRDVTQMFTGRSVLNKSAIGFAYVGVVCNDSWYYSAVVNYSPVTNNTINLSAHELGHNFGANHDPTCNGSNIMCSFDQLNQPGTEWSPLSVAVILTYILSSGSCMSESFPINFTYLGTGASLNYLKIIASNNININTFLGAVRLSTAGFGYIEAGSSIVLTPTVFNTLGFLAPQGSTLLMRISDVINTCDPLTARVANSSSESISQYNNQLTKNSDIQIHPNPFNTTFELTVNVKEDKKAQLIIYNSLGMKVKQQTGINLSKGFNKLSFNCTHLSKGVYMVEVNLGDSKTVKKIIKI